MVSRDIKDIAGLGEIIGHIKDLILKLIEMWAARDERNLKKRRLELENTREFLELAERYNLTPEQLNNYVNLAKGDSIRLTDQTGFDCGLKIKSRSIKHLPAIGKITKD
jgi:hypothetical protein